MGQERAQTAAEILKQENKVGLLKSEEEAT